MKSLKLWRGSQLQSDKIVYTFSIPGENYPFYVGMGQPQRPYDHFRDSNRRRKTFFYNKLNSLLRADIQPIIKIVASNLTNSQAWELEKSLILIYGRLDLGTGCLTNTSDGGESGTNCNPGREQSIDTRIKLSHRKHSEPAILKMKTAARKRGRSVESFSLLTGLLVKQYPCLRDVELDGYNHGCISSVIAGRKKHAYNLGWRHSSEIATTA